MKNIRLLIIFVVLLGLALVPLLSSDKREIRVLQEKTSDVTAFNPNAKGKPVVQPPFMRKASKATDQAILALFIYEKDKTWFLKMIGSQDALESQRNNFIMMLGSIQFDDSEKGIAYIAPQAWQELPASGMRAATFKVDGQDIDISLMSLPGRQDVKANVSRWQGQVGVAVGDEEFTKIKEMPLKGMECIIVSIYPPLQSSNTASVAPAHEKSHVHFHYQVPTDWTRETKSEDLGKQVLTKTFSGPAKIKVTAMPPMPEQETLAMWKGLMGKNVKEGIQQVKGGSIQLLGNDSAFLYTHIRQASPSLAYYIKCEGLIADKEAARVDFIKFIESIESHDAEH